MRAYSEDLRERVIRAVEAGRPREEVAALAFIATQRSPAMTLATATK